MCFGSVPHGSRLNLTEILCQIGKDGQDDNTVTMYVKKYTCFLNAAFTLITYTCQFATATIGAQTARVQSKAKQSMRQRKHACQSR